MGNNFVTRMTFIDKILGKKKKPALKAKCPITKESIDEGFGYMLTTSQVVASKKYWDMVMTEPETLSYTVSHFKNQDSGTQMRNLIFEKYSSIDKAWMVSDSCINLFDIDKSNARANAKKWWETEGDFSPNGTGKAVEKLDPSRYEELKNYAVLEAGKSRIIL
jgi:hypothetical protein